MWRRGLVLTFLLVSVHAASVGARVRATGEELMRVVSPASRKVAGAHPHVNAVVVFGTAKDGTPADPTTFRAKLNGKDVTGTFHAVMTNDVQTGVRAALPGAALRLTSAPRNRLRLAIQSVKPSGGKRARDVDRVRFGAKDVENGPPVATLASGTDVAVLAEPITFDASGSSDPDLDELTFSWTFSDGGTAEGPVVSHAFGTAGPDDMVSATVTVSDGVDTATRTAAVPLGLDPDPGRTAGRLRVEGSALELSPVALGASASRTLVVHNTDTTPTSQLKVHALVLDAQGFTVSPAELVDLGPDASMTFTVTFAPTTPGHASARLALIASASNRRAITMLAHGYGGVAPGDGPTLLAVPVFAALGTNITRLGPDGGRTVVNAETGSCGPPGTAGTGDACIVDGDCATGGEICAASGTPIDVSDACSDAKSLYVLSEDTFTDPNPDGELAGSLVRFDLDPNGTVTGSEVLYRTTDDTTVLACDGFSAAAGGLAYLSEFHSVTDTDTCSRDERDALVAINKNTGNARTVSGFSRIDAVPGVGECDFRDPVDELVVSADGVRKYAGFDQNGLWRIAPTPVFFTPDVRDRFRVHPDGSVAFAIGSDLGASGTVALYRLTESQVEHGALPVSTLAPCATFTVPNNTSTESPSTTLVTTIVLTPAASGDGAVALVTFYSRPANPAFDVLPPTGDLRGTVAFSLPSATTACDLDGLVSLQATDLYQ
jgi:hypothetical protein